MSFNSKLAVGLMLVAFGACSQEETLRAFCTGDADCPPGFRCDSKNGLCLCASDDVCRADEYCAPDGVCRPRMSCDNNLDCEEGLFCDTTTGNCIEIGKCTKDAQCPLGTVCSQAYFECLPGCQVAGDCPLGQVCRAGSCREGLCDDTSFCDYGQLCDSESETCFDDTRGPFCERCAPGTITDPYRCDPGPNFCVMTNNDPSLPPFCAVDCSQDQPCPNGYGCNLILTAPGGSCESDAECESNDCHINEGDTVGFCLCTAHEQCPRDTCDDFTMHCRITRRLCFPGNGDCDRPIYCIDGLCLIGRNCTPLEGLDCADFGK